MENAMNLEQFMDTNFTKPQKLSITTQEYHAIMNEVNQVLSDLKNFTNTELGLTDILYFLMAKEVLQILKKFESKTRWLGMNQNFEINLPVHICLFLLDFISVEGVQYSSDVRIPRGKLDTIISKNEFAAKFASVNQILHQFETEVGTPIQVKEYREPQRIGNILPIEKYG